MDTITLSAITVFLVILWGTCRHLIETYTYWQRHGIPSAPAVPIFGSVLHVLNRLTHEVDLERQQKYGKIYGMYEMWRPVLTLADAKLLRDILVKDFQNFPGPRIFPTTDAMSSNMLFLLHGEAWKRIRTIVSPIFSSGKIKKMFDIIMDSTKTLNNNFSKAVEKGEPIDVKIFSGGFTMDVIASTAFGTKIDSHNDPENMFVKHGQDIFKSEPNWRFILAAFFPTIVKIFRVALFKPSATDFFKQAIMQIIKERKSTGKKRNDFLQLLMDAEENSDVLLEDQKDDEDEKYTTLIETNKWDSTISKSFHNKSLTHDELVANCVLFFLGGYDTTSSTIAFAAYNLALNPEWQDKVTQEIDDCIRQNQNNFSYEAVQEMKILDMVVLETLRLYPPLIRVERRAEEDYKLGNTGITIPKGMLTAIPVYAIQHNPQYYPDPEKFDPNRFCAEEKAKRDPCTYLPFGGGPRSCVARRFALMEVKTCLAAVLSQFRFEKSPKTKIPLEFSIGQGFMIPKEILLQIKKRNDNILSI